MHAQPNLPKPPVAGLALNEHDALPAGTRFGEFEIIRALGVGGFGIVYLAQDHSLERQVALKEYMPAALAARGDGAMVKIRASSFAATYAIGLRSFVNEARLLARFDHPSLVKVYRFWEDNGTAYMVMPYLPGRTLRDARRSRGSPPDEAWIRSVLDPLLDALELLHREGVFHRDVAPDNIVLTPEGTPVLLDFGAARRVISDRSQSLTAILKPNYAPIEQYAEMAAMRQGAWTDIYALGAVLHYLVFGVPPEPATARAVQPDAERIEQRVAPGVSPRFISVVAWMLGVRPLERPQNVAAVRAALDGLLPVPSLARHEVTRPAVTPVPAAVFDATAVDPVATRTLHVPLASADDRPDAETSSPVTEQAAPRGAPPTLLPTDSLGVAAGGASAAAGRATGAAVPRPDDLGRATVPGPAPMRSTPPGMPPPAYVPPPRPPSPEPEPALADAAPATMVGTGRRSWAMAGMAGALAVAALVLWQFVGVVGRARGVEAAPRAAAVAPASAAAAVSIAASESAPKADTAADKTADGTPDKTPDGTAGAVPVASPSTEAEAGPTAGQVASVPESGTDATAALVAPADAPEPATPSASTSRVAAATAAGHHRSRAVRRNEPTRAERLAAAQPATVREACADRSFFSLAICLDRQCERPRFRDEPQCVRMLEARRRRSGNY